MNGDPNFGSFSIVFWNSSGNAEEVGFYSFYPTFEFFINSSKIKWHGDEEVSAFCLDFFHNNNIDMVYGFIYLFF